VSAYGGLAHLSASGQPDLRFGVSGRASIGPLSLTGPPLIDTSDVPDSRGELFPAQGYDNALAVSQSSQAGSGIPNAVAKSTIQVTPASGRISVCVQLASHPQPLAAATVVPLVPRTTEIGDGTNYAHYAAQVRAPVRRPPTRLTTNHRPQS
jgi:hypothetical protein